jgi:hypothetical protein
LTKNKDKRIKTKEKRQKIKDLVLGTWYWAITIIQETHVDYNKYQAPSA